MIPRILCLPDATGPTHELTGTVTTCTGPHRSKPDKAPVVRLESRHEPPSLIKKLSSPDIYLYGKICFLQWSLICFLQWSLAGNTNHAGGQAPSPAVDAQQETSSAASQVVVLFCNAVFGHLWCGLLQVCYGL